MIRRGALTSSIVGVMGIAVAACSAPRTPLVLSNPDPSGKIPAIKLSVQRGEKAAAPQLIKDLESDDPAVRFYAIQGLERLTGETFGYRYYDDERERRPALEKWQAWLRGWEAGSSQP